MKFTSLSYILAAALGATLLIPPAAMAEETNCTTICEEYEFCAGHALQAIYDGVFSGSGCADYNGCGQVVEDCRREAGTCEPSCSHDYANWNPDD
ncbi:hypothetical protein [Pararhodobacter oceanensis]|uniref:hypothetical protein n=1 Tax=Pararhodobacter oceanensis TaxID=2172121 RepID=UPI003A8F40A6